MKQLVNLVTSMTFSWQSLKKWIGWLLIACFLLILSSKPGLTQSTSELEKLREWKQKVEQQRQNLSQQDQKLSDLEKAAMQYLQSLQETVAATDNQIQDYTKQLQQADQTLKTLEIRLKEAQKAYQPKKEAVIARLRFLQRQSLSTQGWELLLKSDSINQLLDRHRRLKSVYQADRDTLEKLQQAADEIKQQSLAIAMQQNEISLIKQQLLAQKDQFQNQSHLQKQLIDRLKGDRQALIAAETQLSQDSEGIALLIQRRINQQNRKPRGNGRLIYPHSGRISSYFGWREHPILKSRRLHNGIDFAGGHGSPIQAAGQGVVIFAGWYGGYGNSIIIDHGGGITTLYAHASQLYVREGITVKPGQAIAAVGSTGLSTGPHLHFEVRENGKPVNPLNYL
jgi:murein DD-endopeptidase MepM/ murein hydrolase activator NlpD